MLTLQELAERIGKPYTTIKDYRRRFKYYFVEKRVAGKRYPMYTDTALDVMRDIFTLYADGRSTDEIHEALKDKYPVTTEPLKEVDERRGKTSDDGVTTATATTTTLDIVTRQQVTLFQVVTQQSQALNTMVEQVKRLVEQNQKLITQNQTLIEHLTQGNTTKQKPETKRKPVVVRKPEKKPAKPITRPQKVKEKPRPEKKRGGFLSWLRSI